MIGIVTGLTSEARCWARQPFGGHALCTVGHGSTRARNAAEKLVQRGITGLVSFGLAGGLVPVLRPGTVVLAKTVVMPTPKGSHGQQLFFPDRPWRERLRTRLTNLALAPLVIPIASSDHVISTVDARKKLASDTGAGAVDMESGAVALCARTVGLPFVVVRVTADPIERTLPPAVLSSVDSDGEMRPFRMLCALARKPAQWPDFFRLLCDSFISFKVLCRVAERAGADCAFSP